MTRLSGKSALITGAARGVGLGFAKAYIAEGATVAIGDINIDAAKAVAADLGPTAYPIGLNVTQQDSIDACMDAVVAKTGNLIFL